MASSGACSCTQLCTALVVCACVDPLTAPTRTATDTMMARTRDVTQEPVGLDARGDADHGGEALHPLETFVQALAPKVEDDLAHAKAGEGGDIVLDLTG